MKCPQCYDSSKLLLEKRCTETRYYSVNSDGGLVPKAAYGNNVSEVLFCASCGESSIPFIRVNDDCIAEPVASGDVCSCGVDTTTGKTLAVVCDCNSTVDNSGDSDGRDVRTRVKQESKETLIKYRDRLLKSVGMGSTAELVGIAEQRVLTENEDAVAYQLENIAFLLGEGELRIR